jgi:ribosome-binding protein aMBF1 (putative translation factor)
MAAAKKKATSAKAPRQRQVRDPMAGKLKLQPGGELRPRLDNRVKQNYNAITMANTESTLKPDGNAVGDAIRQAREAAGYTQAQLAKRVGMDRTNVSRLERGRSPATSRTLQRIADATRRTITIRFEPS